MAFVFESQAKLFRFRFIEKTNLAVKDWITSVYKIKRIRYKIQLD
jgi:hypothetical protein